MRAKPALVKAIFQIVCFKLRLLSPADRRILLTMTLSTSDAMDDLKELLKAFDALNALRVRAGMKEWSDATLGSYSVRNPNLLIRLRAGDVSYIQDHTLRRARAWLKAETAKLNRGRK